MKNNILLIILLALFCNTDAQPYLGLEQYYYFGKNEEASLVTIGYYQNAHDWYGEVHYNYEEEKTMSIYAGKTFYKEGKFSYTITPMVGLLIGQYKGGAVGVNLDVTFKRLQLSSQTQYIFSKGDRSRDFILNWSEFSYQLLPFIRTGIALQQSSVYRSALEMEPGGFVGFSYKNWQLPIYVFSPASKERNYVVGISWEWQHRTSNKNHNPVPSVKGGRNLVIVE